MVTTATPTYNPLTQAMWNWATYHRTAGGAAKTREDWMATWGDLGGAMYDWGRTMWDQGLGESVTQDAFQSQIAGLGQTSKIGGAVGTFYAPPPDQEPTAQQDFGAASDAMLDLIRKHVGVYGALSRDALSNAWGELGTATYDWLASTGGLDTRGAPTGSFPDDAKFREVISYLAYTKPPGGSQGFVYAGAPNVQQAQQNWQNTYNQKIADANEAYRQAQLALANGDQALAQQQFALGQKAQSDANALAYAQMGQQGQQFNVGATGYTQGQDYSQMAQGLMGHIQSRLTVAGGLTKGDLAGAWGDLGNKAYDWLVATGVLRADGSRGPMPLAQGDFVQWAASTAMATPPGGNMGQAYGPQKSLDRTRIEADIAATNERIRIADEQGNAQLALDERKRVDALQIQLGQLGQQEAGITGYYGGTPTFAREQYETQLKANPRDWTQAWAYQRGKDPTAQLTVPPWLQNVAQNKTSAAFQGSSGGLGTFPIKAPDPNQVNASTWNTLAPSEQEGLAGLASSSGWYIPDYIAQMQNSWTRQKNVQPANIWSGGY